MALSSNLISEFVKITKDDASKKSEVTVYGTVVKDEASTYVKFDGSELLTPVTSTTNVEDGERVTVMIKNHSAVITGNITSPSARTAEVEDVNVDLTGVKQDVANIKILSADKVSTKELEAQIARIDTLVAGQAEIGDLKADNVTIKEKLVATEADIGNLKADNVTINEKLVAAEADIEKLYSDEIVAEHITALIARVNEITSNKLTTDELYAAFAKLTVLTAGTAEFDRATVEHLVANLFNLTGSAVMEEVFIHNLKVAYAQMASAAIGNLCIKSSEGEYYTIDVDQNGNVKATLASVTEDEVTSGLTGNGKVILETDITAGSLNTSDLLATHALINKIDAARIDVDQLFAREAVVTALKTTDISSNTYIQQSIRDVSTEQVERYVRLDNNGLHVGASDKVSEILIDDDSVDVNIRNKTYTRLGVNYLQAGQMQMRGSSDGGMIFRRV